ncbi:uncharacterized protein EV422DRAFT_502556 [Fimicolochytrium jonesii]|uniref:uncharacterized protein n=1 Tax=Fimicolochytrium jonesii TaxID=1396493 RepID=UPI0022FE981E|nr:uncharacterized protein EV422DRAFT_502556 [Fimicolochytrium jonesii]KAI8826803.1 hypothetical protein EV422DRAFT_502556 [Fimicolochytrium jonesii]
MFLWVVHDRVPECVQSHPDETVAELFNKVRDTYSQLRSGTVWPPGLVLQFPRGKGCCAGWIVGVNQLGAYFGTAVNEATRVGTLVDLAFGDGWCGTVNPGYEDFVEVQIRSEAEARPGDDMEDADDGCSFKHERIANHMKCSCSAVTSHDTGPHGGQLVMVAKSYGIRSITPASKTPLADDVRSGSSAGVQILLYSPRNMGSNAGTPVGLDRNPKRNSWELFRLLRIARSGIKRQEQKTFLFMDRYPL